MTQRERIRVAKQLQHYWQLSLKQQQEAVVPLASVIKTYLKRLRQSEESLELARSMGLELIEPSLEEKVLFNARSLRITLQDHETSHYPVRHQFLLKDFHQELVQLEQEFVTVRIDWDETLLIVETETIILEDVELGHFTIRLNWKQWAQERTLTTCLKVIAEEPNTAELNDEVTHPHVREGELCAGDAFCALHKALDEGRLAEAFLIVRSVLTNYNSKSAYVRLDEWHGTPCFDCGHVVNDDDRYCCQGCENDYCSGCTSSCSSCHNSSCLSCMGTCSVCNDSCCESCSVTCAISEQALCPGCQETCPGCQRTVGPGDLDIETGLCSACQVDEPETLTEEISHEALQVAAS